MKPSLSLLTVFVFFAFFDAGFAAKPPAVGRKLTDIDVIPTRVLQRSISPKFYQSLLISPVQVWIDRATTGLFSVKWTQIERAENIFLRLLSLHQSNEVPTRRNVS